METYRIFWKGVFFFWGPNLAPSSDKTWRLVLCCRRVLLGLSEKGKPSFPLVNWFIIIIITVPKIILLITYIYIYIFINLYLYIYINLSIYICHIAPLHRMCTCKICIYIYIYIDTDAHTHTDPHQAPSSPHYIPLNILVLRPPERCGAHLDGWHSGMIYVISLDHAGGQMKNQIFTNKGD